MKREERAYSGKPEGSELEGTGKSEVQITLRAVGSVSDIPSPHDKPTIKVHKTRSVFSPEGDKADLSFPICNSGAWHNLPSIE